jgi:gas vesicle protein
MENTNDTGKIIAALLVGAVVGGALGILFAPAKGSDTRKKIMGATGDFTDSLKEKFEEFLEDAKKELAPKKDHGA